MSEQSDSLQENAIAPDASPAWGELLAAAISSIPVETQPISPVEAETFRHNDQLDFHKSPLPPLSALEATSLTDPAPTEVTAAELISTPEALRSLYLREVVTARQAKVEASLAAKVAVSPSERKHNLMRAFAKPIELLTGEKPKLASAERKKHIVTERDLLTQESEIGGKIFGEMKKGDQQLFYFLDETTVIWYQSVNKDGKPAASTTRYELQGDKVLKVSEGPRYSYLEGEERDNFDAALEIYHRQVMDQMYRTSTQANTYALAA